MFSSAPLQGALVAPAAPAQAALFGYNQLILDWVPRSDLADVDQTHQGGVTAPSGFGGSSSPLMWTTNDPFNNSAYNSQGIAYDTSKSALKLTSSSDNQFARGISTAWLNSTNTVWYGRTFNMAKGFYLRVLFSFDESLSPSGSGFVPCPAISLYSFVALASGEYLNKSVSEYQRAGAGSVGFFQTLNSENASPTDYTSNNGIIDRGGTSPVPSSLFTSSVFNYNDCLYVPTTDNAGTGIIRCCFNGFTLTSVGGSADEFYSRTGAPSSCQLNGGGTCPNGAFSAAEIGAQRGVLVINAGIQQTGNSPPFTGGPGWPCFIGRMQVWARDASALYTSVAP